MKHLTHTDGVIEQLFGDDEVPTPDAVPITDDEFIQLQAGGRWRYENGGIVRDVTNDYLDAGSIKLNEIDQLIDGADLRVAFIYVAWAVGELLEIASADVTALPAAKRNRLIAIRTKAEKLGLAYLAKKQAEADIVAGVDPDAIPIPDVESFEI